MVLLLLGKKWVRRQWLFMKNKIEPTTGKDGSSSSVKVKNFGSRFSHKRMQSNQKPLKKTE